MDLSAMPRNRLVFIGVVAVVIIAVVAALFFGRPASPTANPVTLTVWGTDQKEAFGAFISAYTALYPNVTVRYSQVEASVYDDTLVNAFIGGQPPDLFMIGNHDVRKRLNILTAVTSTQFDVNSLDNIYPTAVRKDLLVNNRLYGLPLSMDTLALVYNRSLLDQAGIPTPPATWDDLLSDIPKLRKLNAQGQFLETAVALGGTETTVPHAADIVSLLMLQNGTTMNDDSGLASFANRQDGDLGAKALQFYTDFANPSSDAYTWNAAQGQAMESFLAGKTAMIFAYHSELAAIKERSPFLNIAVAPMPQSVSSTINYPSYSALAVSKRSHAPAWAWDFDIFAATNPAANKAYLDIIQAPPALRSLIAGTRSGELSIFARQNLTASSWQITDYAKMKNIFSGAVNSVVNGQAAPQAALDAAQDQVNNIQ